MKKILGLLTVFMLTLWSGPLAGAQSAPDTRQTGVSFREGSTFAEAKEEAGRSDRYIFIDFYATWCVPCKTMDKEVFTDAAVAEYMNRTFVNLKVDGEAGEGIDLVRQFRVRAYPTFVVLQADGSEVFRIVGARSASAFREELEKGLDDRRTPEMVKKRYEAGERSPSLVNDYVLSVMQSGDEAAGYQLINDYFHSLTREQKADPANAFLYERYAQSLDDEKLAYVFANRDDFARSYGEEWVQELMYRRLRLELIPYANGYRARTGTYDESVYAGLKQQIENAGLKGVRRLDYLLEIADARGSTASPDAEFIFVCERVFPQLVQRDRFLLMHSFAEYSDHPSARSRQKAAQLINDYIHELSETTVNAMRKILAELEFADQQSDGVAFQDLTFDAALKAAGEQDKLIFLDAFTTWCGPCKMMDRQVFARDEVGEFFNPQFINLKVDMEKGEGPGLAERYNVRAYPTFLLINSEGELLHRIVGFHNAEAFMDVIRNKLAE